MRPSLKLLKVYIALAVIFGVVMLDSGPSQGETDSSREYLVKAAFVYNFAKFVQWPEGSFTHSGAPIIITILGKDPFGSALKTLENKTVRGHPLQIHKIRQIDELKDTHILFVAQSEHQRTSAIIAKIDGWPVLTVSDMDDFTQQGGSIQFYTKKSKIRFDINSTAVYQNGLRISSQLLQLAQPKNVD